MRALVYHTKGLGPVARHELHERLDAVSVQLRSPKYTAFETASDATRLLDLRTVDDAHVLLTVERFDDAVDAGAVVDRVPLDALASARALVSSLRDVDDAFSITCSRYRSDVDGDALASALADRIADHTGARYDERDHSNLDVRVHVAETTVLVSCRLSAKPLYYRSYRRESRPGSLRPSVAAALCRLLHPGAGAALVDDLCGAGTILCEGFQQELVPHGGDHDDDAVRAARENLWGLSTDASRRVRVQNATATTWADDRFDVAVSNVPWGDQVDLHAVGLYSRLVPEYARILRDDGRLVLLGPKPDLLTKHLRASLPDHTVDRFQLGFLGQRPWVCYAHPPDASPNVTDRSGEQ